MYNFQVNFLQNYTLRLKWMELDKRKRFSYSFFNKVRLIIQDAYINETELSAERCVSNCWYIIIQADETWLFATDVMCMVTAETNIC